PAASQQATSRCWLAVINDWLDNNRIDRVYAIPCYTQAIQHLSAYPDVAGYSSAADDIKRAELDAIHQDRQNGPQSGSFGGQSSGGSNASGPPPTGGGGGSGPGNGSSSGPIGQIGQKLGPGDA